MLKYSRGKLIVFDIEEALSFEGESGPYLQYAAVRANNIFQKLQERESLTEADILGALDTAAADELTEEDSGLWGLVFEAARLDDIVEQVARSLEFSILAKYAFGLAQLFNAFYHRFPILNEERVERKRWRAAGVAYVRQQLTLRARSDGNCSTIANVVADRPVRPYRVTAIGQARTKSLSVRPGNARRALAELVAATRSTWRFPFTLAGCR